MFYSSIMKMIHVLFTVGLMFLLVIVRYLMKTQVSKNYYFYILLLLSQLECKYVKLIVFQMNFFRYGNQQKIKKSKILLELIIPLVIINFLLIFLPEMNLFHITPKIYNFTGQLTRYFLQHTKSFQICTKLFKVKV